MAIKLILLDVRFGITFYFLIMYFSNSLKCKHSFYNQKHRKIKCSFSLWMNVQTSLHQSPKGWARLFLHSTLQIQGSYQQCGPANVALDQLIPISYQQAFNHQVSGW